MKQADSNMQSLEDQEEAKLTSMQQEPLPDSQMLPAESYQTTQSDLQELLLVPPFESCVSEAAVTCTKKGITNATEASNLPHVQPSDEDLKSLLQLPEELGPEHVADANAISNVSGSSTL